MIAQGEHEGQDFKYKIADSKKIARSISAFANRGGGRLLIGVKDNGRIAGVQSDEEIYMVDQAAQLYCQPPQTVNYTVVTVNGKQVVIAQVPEAVIKPVKAPDEQGNFKVYYRVADENILASAYHARALMYTSEGDNAVTLNDWEMQLLAYIHEHGGITLQGFIRLAHISYRTACQSVERLFSLHLIQITYHHGSCLIVEP